MGILNFIKELLSGSSSKVESSINNNINVYGNYLETSKEDKSEILKNEPKELKEITEEDNGNISKVFKNNVVDAKNFLKDYSGYWEFSILKDFNSIHIEAKSNPANIQHIKSAWCEKGKLYKDSLIPHLVVNLFKAEDFYYYHCFNLLQEPRSFFYVLDYTDLQPIASDALNDLIQVETIDQYLKFVDSHRLYSIPLKIRTESFGKEDSIQENSKE